MNSEKMQKKIIKKKTFLTLPFPFTLNDASSKDILHCVGEKK
jgi:hypothetical protein